MFVTMIDHAEQKRAIARAVQTDLPEWFGIPESMEAYIRESADQPFFAAKEGDEAIGFMTLKETSPYTAELAGLLGT